MQHGGKITKIGYEGAKQDSGLETLSGIRNAMNDARRKGKGSKTVRARDQAVRRYATEQDSIGPKTTGRSQRYEGRTGAERFRGT